MFFVNILFAVFVIVSCSNSSFAQFCKPPFGDLNVVSECDYCQCSQGISPLETGSTGIRFDVRSLYRGAAYNGTEKQANPDGVYESYLTNQLILNYRFAESPFTASVSVPYVVRQAHDPTDEPVNVKGEGISDITAIVRYNNKHYIDEAMIGYSIAAGVKLATGSTDSTNSVGDFLDPHIRPGTGTTDIIIGGAGFWSLDKVGLTASATVGIITGHGAPMSGGYHKFGNYLIGEITAQYRIIPADINESNLSIVLGIGGETHGHEIEGGQDVIASGESLIYIAPGLKYIISMKFSLDASIDIPIYQYQGWDPATGENQLGQTYRVIAGFQFLL